jgi:hypothetical protein
MPSTDSVEIQSSSKPIIELPDHLKLLLDCNPPDLSSEDTQKLRDLLLEFQDIFSPPEGPLGHTELEEHEINTGNHKPVKIPLIEFPGLREKSLIRK